MADYIYLLENRLSPAQQRALSTVRNAVRARELTLFLTGGAVRDLTGGGSVRDLDVTVQGETTLLRKDLEAAGAVFAGEFNPAQSLFFVFPGGVRIEISAAMSVTFPKPGKPKYELTSIGEDLRRRDFTANAMALSLNEGSYGLLMDPLNGVADIENRELRLVSNYGFIEDPARLVRATRLASRLGWQMEARTQQRYENAKEDASFDVLSKFARGYEIEEVFHEEDPQRIMRALDAEGWLAKLSPQLQLGKANEAALADLRDKQGQLQTQGILADSAALSFPLLVAKLASADIAALKSSFARAGFAREIETLDERTRELQSRFNGKEAAVPSAAWRMLYEAEPGLVLSMFYTGKGGSVQARLKTFLGESPTARQRLPYQLMQEMRILPDMPIYHELLDKVFYELMDGKLQTTEEMKAYLEPFSPPAPPPPLNLRRARAKKEARPSRAKAKKSATVAAEEEAVAVAEGLMEPGTLTGADRGTEPTVHESLDGNVAPLAPGEPEPDKTTPAEKKKVAGKDRAKVSGLVAGVAGETGSAVAKKLSALPAPMPVEEAEALLPHPLATKEIAEKPAAVLPSVPVSMSTQSRPIAAKTGPGVAARPVPTDRLDRNATKSGTAAGVPAKRPAVAGKPGTAGESFQARADVIVNASSGATAKGGSAVPLKPASNGKVVSKAGLAKDSPVAARGSASSGPVNAAKGKPAPQVTARTSAATKSAGDFRPPLKTTLKTVGSVVSVKKSAAKVPDKTAMPAKRPETEGAVKAADKVFVKTAVRPGKTAVVKTASKSNPAKAPAKKAVKKR